jgi:hypothetical protein
LTSPQLAGFVAAVRRWHPSAVVLPWVLTSLEAARLRAEGDGAMTNSAVDARARGELYLPLAADAAVMHPGAAAARYSCDVAYVGVHRPEDARLHGAMRALAARGVDVAVYGAGWEHAAWAAPLWRGALPRGDIAALYGAARVVLGSTTPSQARHGMVNNRVFEALACGAALVMFEFDAAVALFGDAVGWAASAEEMVARVVALLANEARAAALAERGRALILDRHTYARRVVAIREYAQRVLAQRVRGGADADAEGGRSRAGRGAEGEGAAPIMIRALSCDAPPVERAARAVAARIALIGRSAAPVHIDASCCRSAAAGGAAGEGGAAAEEAAAAERAALLGCASVRMTRFALAARGAALPATSFVAADPHASAYAATVVPQSSAVILLLGAVSPPRATLPMRPGPAALDVLQWALRQRRGGGSGVVAMSGAARRALSDGSGGSAAGGALAALLRACDDVERRLAVVQLDLEGGSGAAEDTFAVDEQVARAATLRLGESTRAIETLVGLLPLLDACVVLSGPEHWLAQLCAGAAVPTIAVEGAQPPSVGALAGALSVEALRELAAPLGAAAAARARAAAEAALVALLDASCAASRAEQKEAQFH